jgi:general secretion pathway protein G
MKTKKTKAGFTLVEILIVVVILGILAAIVIPQFTQASTEAREASLRSNLQSIRSQIELYKIQHNDIAPTDNTTFANQMIGRTDQDGTVNAAGVFGPYIQSIPLNPFTSGATINAAYVAGADWTYSVDAQGDPTFSPSDDAVHATW